MRFSFYQNLITVLSLSCLIQLGSVPSAYADIPVGMSTALSGPLKAVGNSVKSGIEAYFNKINSSGGVNGEKIVLITKDDGYEPKLTAPNMRTLIEEEDVLAILGNVGTPTAIVSVPIATENEVPFIGAITGAPLLRSKPPNRYIFNYRASYSEEVANMVEGLLALGIKPEEIALFTQRDGYGDAGYEGAINALMKHGYENVHALPHGRYTRNSMNVEGALATILESPVDPKAIIMAGGYAPSAKFIKLAKEDLPDCLFLNLSFVGSMALLQELEGNTQNVIVTQVVPSFDSKLPIAEEYRQDLKYYTTNMEPSFLSFEGYIIAKIFVAALQSIQGEINRESLTVALNQMHNMDIGLGIDISFTSYEHQAAHKVWPMLINSGAYVPIDWTKISMIKNNTIYNDIE